MGSCPSGWHCGGSCVPNNSVFPPAKRPFFLFPNLPFVRPAIFYSFLSGFMIRRFTRGICHAFFLRTYSTTAIYKDSTSYTRTATAPLGCFGHIMITEFCNIRQKSLGCRNVPEVCAYNSPTWQSSFSLFLEADFSPAPLALPSTIDPNITQAFVPLSDLGGRLRFLERRQNRGCDG